VFCKPQADVILRMGSKGEKSRRVNREKIVINGSKARKMGGGLPRERGGRCAGAGAS